MGHKGAPVLLLFSAQSLPLTSRTACKGTHTAGNTAVGRGVKQGQGPAGRTQLLIYLLLACPSLGAKEQGGSWDE